jgi:hypothetical protein
MMGLLILVLLGGTAIAPASAAAAPLSPTEAPLMTRQETATQADSSKEYVFSVGTVDRVSADSLTLRFDDGSTETYRLNATTAVQSQNGDALTRTDLKIGEIAIVLNVQNDPTALTVVSGGSAGFHEAGPADIRGHDQRECAECDAHAP